MSMNLQRQVGTLETRTDSLEIILGQFISSVNGAISRTEADTRAFRREMKEFKDEMRESREKTDATLTRMEADTKAYKKKTDAILTRMEADTRAFKEETRADTKALKKEMTEFKDEIRADTKTFKKEMRAERNKFQREVGRLDNKIGMLAEDMVAPNIPGIAAEYFGDGELESFSTRHFRRKASDHTVRREFDVVAVSDLRFYVCEVKSSPKPEYAGKFADALEELPDYFPDARDRKIVPIFASLLIPPDLVKYLTRMGVYAMGLREDTMELLNFEEVRKNAEG